MTEQEGGNGNGEDLSPEERQFNRRWRELVDRAGGQKILVRHLRHHTGWTKSTVSRDYKGTTLPSDVRVRQLCEYLTVGSAELEGLLRLLEQARLARQARKQSRAPEQPPGLPRPADAMPGKRGQAAAARSRSRGHGRVAALLGAGVLAGCAAAAVVSLWQPWNRPTQSGGVATSPAGAPVARGTYQGIGVKVITIPVRSLTPALGGAFRHGKTSGHASVAGYVFRNIRDTGLCLTAVATGPHAGRNGDRVEVAECDGASNQVWIPEQWEVSGNRFTHLVSYRYQSMCLNARNIGGLGNGQQTMLWNCYPASNESWDFGDWLSSTKYHGQAYPIFVDSARLCLDADKYDYGDGDRVNIWNQYPATNQFWS